MFGCTVNDIVVSNSGLVKNPNLIYTEWVLTIPVGGLAQQEVPSTGSADVYVVQRGDTLSAIAKRHGCKWRDIVALNGDLITDPDFILQGWQLKLPQ